jgi:hypothetical protein
MLRSSLLLLPLLGMLLAAAGFGREPAPSTRASQAVDPQGADPSSPNPLLGLSFWVDQDAPSWHQWRAYRSAGETAKADLIWKIAREPKSSWLGRFTRPNFSLKVRRLIDGAKAQGAVPLFTVLRAQASSCGRTTRGQVRARTRRRGPGTTIWLG